MLTAKQTLGSCTSLRTRYRAVRRCLSVGLAALAILTLAGTVQAQPSNDTCASAITVSCGTGTITGLTLDGASADYTMPSGTSCTGFDADGPDIVFTITPMSDSNITVAMTNVNGFDATLYVITDCMDPENTCVAGNDTGLSNEGEQLTFLGVTGITYYVITDAYTDAPDPGTSFDFAISCAELCGSPVATYPYSEDFESDLGLWTQSSADDADWTRLSGPTSSFDTGPSVDHTLGTSSGFYVYTEATDTSTDDLSILEGPCFDLSSLTNPAFTFWYHMYGADMGTLAVEVSDDNGFNYTEAFSITGDQGDQWHFKQVDLSAYAGQIVKIRFVSTRGADYTSDMAIDDIGVGEGVLITGACCNLDGTCTEGSEGDCSANGGLYRGDLSTCMDVNCVGACCLPDNTCANGSEISCTANGGTFAGEGTVCFAYDINTGASNGGIVCEGSCSDLTILRSSPLQPAGVDIMFNNDIATADEASGTCGGGGDENGNLFNDAVFRYLAISDTNGPCDVTITATPTDYDAVLIVRSGNCGAAGTQIACADSGLTGDAESVTIPAILGQLYIQVGDYGTTEGGGLTELEITCSTATGACCIGSGCEILTAGECLNAEGMYKGDNTDCASSCFGACCLGNGMCTTMTEVSCDDASGFYEGDGISCTPNPCPQPPENDTCATPTVVDCATGTITGLTVDLAGSDYSLDSGTSCTGFSTDGPDIVFSFTPTMDVLVNTGMTNIDGFDASFYVLTDCLDPDNSCVAGDDTNGTPDEEVTFMATSGTTYYLIADSYTSDPDLGTSFDFFISCSAICGTCPGDLNGDSKLDGLDIQAFVGCYVSEYGATPSQACKCADVEDDNIIDELDIPAFVDAILNGGICNPGRCCYLDGASVACAVTDADGCAMLGGDFTLGDDCSGPPCPTPLSNDDCFDATVVMSLPFADLDVDFPNATDDTNVNPSCDSSFSCTTFANNGIWYQYTPDDDCTVTIDVSGADTVTSLWTGPDCNSLTEVRCSDPQTTVETLSGGTTYWILVSNYACNSEPSSTLDVMIDCMPPLPPPANDDCSNATVLTTLPFSELDVDLVNATNDTNALPSCDSTTCTIGASHGVWYQYTPDMDCNATIDVSGADTVISLWTGSDCNSLTEMLCSDPQTVETLLSGGTTYWILVSGYSCSFPPTSTVDVTIDCVPPPPPPVNDHCVDATQVFTGVNAGGNSCSASLVDDAEASCQANSDKDVYYVWTADCTGTATIDTEGSNFDNDDTVLAIFDACGGSEIACDDDGGTSLLSSVSFSCNAGTDYIIRVAGYNTGSVIRCGDVTLNIACAP